MLDEAAAYDAETMSDQPSQRPAPSSPELDLSSVYQGSPSGRAHIVTLQLSAESSGSRKGVLGLDPNICTIDEWGDRGGCTKMAIRALEITTTRMRTLDPTGHRRVLHRVHSEDFHEESANLIEHPAAGLWTLVYMLDGGGHWVVPLFDAKLFVDDDAGTIAMRYGVPMREVLQRGDLDEMKAEIETVSRALAALDAAPALRTARSVRDDHITDVKAALAELEAAVAELES